MEKISRTVLVLASFFLLLQPSLSRGDETFRTDLEESYSNCLERLISRYNAKSDLRNSKLPNVKRAAALYWFKARFIEESKDELKQQLLMRHVRMREYQIEHFVNQRFFEFLQLAIANVPGISGKEKP
jgi:hypothetical protein